MKKAFFLLVILELAVPLIFVFLDPFHVGVAYMGEGLPLLFSILLSWILVFKLWSLYVTLFILTPPSGDQQDWKTILFLLLLTNVLLVLADLFFIKSKDGLYVLIISFISTSLVFDAWVFWNGWKNRQKEPNVDFLKKCRTLLLIELTTLVVSLLIGDRMDFIMTQLFLSAILAFFWMLQEWSAVLQKKRAALK
jgi:hypothetical protein